MKSIFFIVCIAVSIVARASDNKITGNLEWDLQHANFDSVAFQQDMALDVREKMQNPLYNGLYSLLLPGAGQYHTERYTKAAIFFGVEVALVAYAIISDHNGNKKTEEFQRYANAHWSAYRYAQWINTYGGADYGPTANIDLNKVQRGDYSEINAWEVAPSPNKIGFSHQLPRFGEQQYYELIGKYHQFKFGWSDYPKDQNGIPISDNRQYDDLKTAKQQITSYMAERARANDYYYAASFAASVLVINHVISAIDAYLSTKAYNREISASLGLRPVDSYEGKRLLSELKISVGL